MGGKLGSNKFKWDVLLILVYWGLKQTGIMGPNQGRWGTGYHPGLGHGKWYRCRSFLKMGRSRTRIRAQSLYIYIYIRAQSLYIYNHRKWGFYMIRLINRLANMRPCSTEMAMNRIRENPSSCTYAMTLQLRRMAHGCNSSCQIQECSKYLEICRQRAIVYYWTW